MIRLRVDPTSRPREAYRTRVRDWEGGRRPVPSGTGAKRSPDKPDPAWRGKVCSEKESVTTNGLMEPETRGTPDISYVSL